MNESVFATIAEKRALCYVGQMGASRFRRGCQLCWWQAELKALVKRLQNNNCKLKRCKQQCSCELSWFCQRRLCTRRLMVTMS